MCFKCNLQINFVTFSACLIYLHKLYVLELLVPQYNLYLASIYLVYYGKVSLSSLIILPSEMGSNL